MTRGPTIKAQAIVSAPFLLCRGEGAPLACGGQVHRAWLDSGTGTWNNAGVGGTSRFHGKLSPEVSGVSVVQSSEGVINLDSLPDILVEVISVWLGYHHFPNLIA